MSHRVLNPFIVLLLAIISFAPTRLGFAKLAQQATSNLIINGNFEGGNTGFVSDYVYSPGNIQPAAVYDVPSNPASGHPFATSFGDHTSGQGLMMTINGSESVGATVWSQTVSVTPNTDYEFSAWIASWFFDSPAQLQFLINGSQIGTFTGSSTTGLWQQFARTWNSGVNTSALIEIIDVNTANVGNDFALDDLSFRSLACSTLIANNDFESGNTGFSSEYAFSPNNTEPAAVYDMLTNPSSGHPFGASFGDHTSGLGLMMAVNGSESAGAVVWSQTVPVTVSTDYEFSAWVASWFFDSPAQLQFRINGNQIGTFTASSTTGLWQQFAVTWNSGSNTSATVEIIDLNTANVGNDFALDDLTFRSFACEIPTPTPTGTQTNTLTNTPTTSPTNTSTPTPTETPGFACPSLIANGDFEAGNTGFSSDYAFTPGDLSPSAVYDLPSNPSSSHPSAFSFGDHTSGLGLMMAINGADSPGAVVWAQSVPVVANSDYEFSAWIASWYPVSPAQLQFRINGSQVGTFTASSTTGVWQQFAAIWDSGTSTSATIEIISLNSDLSGNDFALDDLSIRSFTCDTHTPTSTNTPTNTPTATQTATSTPTSDSVNTPSNTPTNTPSTDLGQLKLCVTSGSGIPHGQVFTIEVDDISYNVLAGYCVLAGQFPLNTQITVRENIPAGYYVSRIEVKPEARAVSKDRSRGMAVVQIGTGVTEVIFTNRIVGTPTSTSTPQPTRTHTSTPICSPNCTSTPTPIPTGRFQICKEADGAGVSGNFTFRFHTNSRSVPVGACSLISSANAGTLTITEDERAGYVLSDVYTIPSDRLISKNLNNRTVTVTIVPGNASLQTIIVFVNRAVTAATLTDVVANVSERDIWPRGDPLDVFVYVFKNSIAGW